MKIDKIQSKVGTVLGNQKKSGQVQQPSFGNATTVAVDTLETLAKARMTKGERGFYKFINSLLPFSDEFGGIVTTAIGTGFVAPIFIGFNPFVKAKPGATEEEKKDVSNTKKYSALRQPVSAFIAIVLQGPITKWVDRQMDKIFNNPNTAKDFSLSLDRSALNSKSYIERTLKKKMKSGQIEYDTSKPFKEELARLVKEEQEAQINKVAGLATDTEGNVIEGFKQTGEIHISGRKVDSSTIRNIVNEQIERYVEELEGVKISEDIPEKGMKVSSVDANVVRAEKLFRNKDLYLTKLEEASKTTSKAELDAMLNQIMEANKADKTLQEILGEIVKMGTHEEQVARCKSTIQRIYKVEHACGGEYSAQTYSNVMRKMNRSIDEIIAKLRSCKIADGVTPDGNQVREIMGKLTEICSRTDVEDSVKIAFRKTDTFGKAAEGTSNKVIRDIIKAYNNQIARQHSLFAQITKIFTASFIALPICCTALNWVYPRFVELVCPSIAGVKKTPVASKDGGTK